MISFTSFTDAHPTRWFKYQARWGGELEHLRTMEWGKARESNVMLRSNLQS